MINYLIQYDYLLFLIGAILLIWLVWLPRVLAPILIPRYDKFPPKLKAAVALILPTLEKTLLSSWDSLYHDVIEPIADDTETELDNAIWKEINEVLHKLLEQSQQDTEPITPIENETYD